MIRFTTGDILAEDVEALVNPVNCVGVMGRGLALQFRKAYPECFHAYAKACKRRDVKPGRMFVFETGALSNPRMIVNFPTKRHWRDNSMIEDIEAGLEDLAKVIHERDLCSIAVPALGSGLGGLEWSDVRPRIEKALGGFDNVEVVVFEPWGEHVGNGERGETVSEVVEADMITVEGAEADNRRRRHLPFRAAPPANPSR